MSSAKEARAGFPLSPRETAAAIAAAVILAATAAAVSLANTEAEHRAFLAVINALTIATLIGVGLFAWRREPQNRFGRLLVIAGLGWFLVSMSASSSPLLYSVGRVSAWGEEVLLIYLFLSYPFGRLPDGPSRLVVGVAAATVALLFVPTALLVSQFPVPSPYSLCTDDCPANALALASSEPEFIDAVVRPVRDFLAAGAFLGTALILGFRVSTSTLPMRHTVSPVLVAAAFGAMVAFVYVGVRRAGIASDATLETLAAVRSLTTPVAAVGFLVGLLAWQLREARALEQLALASASSATPRELQALLARTLEDPTLEIRYCSDGLDRRWRDVDGDPVSRPAESGEKALVFVEGAGSTTVAILCDPGLGIQRGMVEAAGSWIGTSLERQRLNGLLRESLRDVESSRRRLATAAASERRRIERDLHDGAQQRLVTLRIQLELAEEELARDPEAGARRLHELGPSVDSVIDDVRSLARGIYPPLLADAGLGEALKAVAAREAMPVNVLADDAARYPLEIESAVYFCCLEALQNAAKHSGGASVSIDIKAIADSLRFEVRDEGAGFIVSRDNGGAGLTNMRDRIAAVGGVLVVDSSPGHGTRVSGEVPVHALA
jgi:signal transduction histidine kinase